MPETLTPFATTDDLEARWRDLSAAEKTRAAVLIDDASSLIRALRPGIDADIDADLMDPNLPRAAVCSMVRRAMQAGGALAGVTQVGQTTGPFSVQQTFSNPSGDLFLSAAEKKLLGIGRQRAFMVDLAPVPPPVVIVSETD